MASSMQDYLKRYNATTTTRGDDEIKSKPKKKRKVKGESTKLRGSGVVIVDDDGVWQKEGKPEEEEPEEDVDKPTVIEDVDVKVMQRMETLKVHRPYLSVANDGSGWVTVKSDNEEAWDGTADHVGSPTRSGREKLSPPLSPPRRKDTDLDLPSPTKRHDSPDLSPPRKKDFDLDLSPPRKRHDSRDLSPPRRKDTNLDLSPPRKRHDSRDLPPPRRKDANLDLSPPRRRHDSRDLSPPRRKDTNVDLSPPRKRHDSRDYSPSRRKDKNLDLSPPRKRVRSKNGDDDNDRSAMKHKMADGSVGGLKTDKQVVEEIRRKKAMELKVLADLDPSQSGRGAETVYRDKRGRRLEGLEELLRQQKGEAKPAEKPLEWGKGLAQKRELESKFAELEAERNKPFARTRDDPELDKEQREAVRWGDPMAHLVKTKILDPVLPDLGASEEMKASGFIVPQDIPSHSWLKRGIAPPPNRYGIKPGRHWDGVDRSTGYEREMFKAKNERQALDREAYLWSVSDM